ncbi:unnamed protein product, partial [Mesorhabditis belari]|uniref:Uncharacterized protein n=1 Tax=Mesorhabditis belari TaxID=2138241 RepID=A0AAF3J1S5_9BILA
MAMDKETQRNVFIVDFAFGLPSLVPSIAPGLNVADLTKGIQQQVVGIAKQVQRLKRAQFTEDAEEGEDLDEDRFRSGFIPEESPVSDTSKIEAPKETATPAFSSDQAVTTEATVQWQPSSDSSDRGIVHFGDDREETDDHIDQSEGDTVTLFKGDKGSYCTRYEQHFSFLLRRRRGQECTGCCSSFRAILSIVQEELPRQSDRKWQLWHLASESFQQGNHSKQATVRG